MSNNEVIISRVTEASGTNGKEEEDNEYFEECFDDEVLYLRQKR